MTVLNGEEMTCDGPPADATSCPGWACSVENQYCPQGLVGSTDSDYCCVMDEAGSGTWTAGACVP